MRAISLLLVAFCVVVWPRAGRAQSTPFALCRSAIGMAERSSGIPDRLMQAIAIVESGKADERGGTSAWPWTINVEGVGYSFETKEQAIAAVNDHRARGARSIDVGCMQVNLVHHGDAFGSLDQAFDPSANARYAADFLQRLMAQTGSWPRAAAGYHSMTPDIGADYARKVLSVWARPGLGDAAGGPTPRRGAVATNYVPPPSVFAAAAPSAPQPPSPGGLALPGSLTARIIPVGAPGGGAAPIGRGLAAYRATPTRMANGFSPPRG